MPRIETITPKSEHDWLKLRAADVTSTEAPALFDISPYMTKFELFHRKRDVSVVTIEQSDRMVWGNRLQDAIAKGIAEDQGWTVRPMKEYLRDPELRMGSSFDFSIYDGLGTTKESGILEIKNVDSFAFKEGWSVEGDEVEAPPHIEMQLQHQLAVSGREVAFIGALIGGNRVVLIKREPDAGIIKRIKEEIAEFWDSVSSNRSPTPDWSVDSAFIARLYGSATKGSVLDATNDDSIAGWAQEYKEASLLEKQAEARKKAAKAHLLLEIGDAEKVIGNGFSISAGEVAPSFVESYEKVGYRNFRINWKKA